jgi:hypothetical protein
MRNVAGKLTILQIQRLTKPGLYADGGCLYLQVTGDGVQRLSRSWVYRFMLGGKRRQMGLGSVDLVSLSEARLKTLECRKLHLEGIDPIEVRKAKRVQAALASAKGMTFKACAEKYIASHKTGWKNDKHAAQWPATLTTYAYPAIGGLAVQNIDIALALKILEPIWATKPETASRLRGRIEVILDWARVHGYRTGENPARWRGHMDKLLPPRSKVKKVKHHAALPYAELPAFMVKLRKEEGVAARALEFLTGRPRRTCFRASCRTNSHTHLGSTIKPASKHSDGCVHAASGRLPSQVKRLRRPIAGREGTQRRPPGSRSRRAD